MEETIVSIGVTTKRQPNPIFFSIFQSDRKLFYADTLHICNGYVFTGLTSIHSLVIGPRPDNIPRDWIIDHKDRNRLNNCRTNLRWASPQFNAWNIITKSVSSKFKGVLYMKDSRRWRAYALKQYLGLYDTEREAAIASSTVYIKTFGEMASTSDLILGNGLLTQSEVDTIVQKVHCPHLVTVVHVPLKKVSKYVAPGVRKLKNGFAVIHQMKNIKQFKTLNDAIAYRENFVREIEVKKWNDYLLTDPDIDEDGDVAVRISNGVNSVNRYTKVDAHIWHLLTFNRKWQLSKDGYVQGTMNGETKLHRVVFFILHPGITLKEGESIDHKVSNQKLDNRGSNLRSATHSQQGQNRSCTGTADSPYKGVFKGNNASWVGRMGYRDDNGKVLYTCKGLSEEEVVRYLDIKRVEVYGEHANLSTRREDSE